MTGKVTRARMLLWLDMRAGAPAFPVITLSLTVPNQTFSLWDLIQGFGSGPDATGLQAVGGQKHIQRVRFRYRLLSLLPSRFREHKKCAKDLNPRQ